ncbi:L-xylulose reductase-like [Panonychus citri]|uniref:L-xylulose reductase-like n=1 Tax=Panonychus citri TaxID=50023 RepID=UPI002308027D|nr:L-xylulose reductase-like [Panonychus citri]XP_053206561.1 L-xylulose reductase-like [Panonychus citri]
MDISFNGKRALVTGAGRGIGRETVKRLVKLGADVVALSKTLENLETLKAELPSIKIVQCDLAHWNETKSVISSLDTIDLLVNNAAFGQNNAIGTVDEEICDIHFNINVKAIINVTQQVVAKLKAEGKSGSIVNISSQAGMVALQDHVVYCASKGAVDQITRVSALELGPFNIRCNSVNPTVVLTELGRKGWSEPTKRDWMLNQIPLRRFAEVDEVVDAIVFLLSDRSSMINGAILPIDGGFTAC